VVETIDTATIGIHKVVYILIPPWFTTQTKELAVVVI
jgi:hypothetical protein